ncbi:MAG TPA: RNase adapter RapZ [Candidatus Kapabacteria bacterium]|nr:RNase adapter RapZ [Candidatus Kapabacteria bacterium]
MKSHLVALYRSRFHADPEAMLDIRADGSNRSLYRLIGPGGTVVGVFGPDHEENRAFLSFSRSLRDAGLPVPEIYASNEAEGIYLEEDLGDVTLFDALTAARSDESGFPQAIVPLYERVVDLLPRVQVLGGRAVDYSAAYPCAEFDRQSMMWDLSYFKYHFVKLARIPFNEARLEADFNRLCDFLLTADRSNFLYRDFQSRNIMIRDGDPWLIDYQGGRRGALHYDIASLLYDAKAALTPDLRDRLLERYIDSLASYLPVDRPAFRELYGGYVLIRILQAMGAYGYRGFFERKPHFLASVPYAVRNIGTLLEAGLPLHLPELEMVLARITETTFETAETELEMAATEFEVVAKEFEMAAKEFEAAEPERAPVAQDARVAAEDSGPALNVHVASFSYRQGYPEDMTGHGGGFVFDCRMLNNPGRHEEYRCMSGCDAAVKEFLEREPEVESFWRNAAGLVDAAVARYLERGFDQLAVAFGCTGGQHRSVYFAERLAQHLVRRSPRIEVHLSHREMERWPASGHHQAMAGAGNGTP